MQLLLSDAHWLLMTSGELFVARLLMCTSHFWHRSACLVIRAAVHVCEHLSVLMTVLAADHIHSIPPSQLVLKLIVAMQDWRVDAGMQQVNMISAAHGVEALHPCPTLLPAQATAVRRSAGPGPSACSHINLHRPSISLDGQGAAAQSASLQTHHTMRRQQPVPASRTNCQAPAITPNTGAHSPKLPAEGLLRQHSGPHIRPETLFRGKQKVLATRQPLQNLLSSSSEQQFGGRAAIHTLCLQGKQVSRQAQLPKSSLPSKDALKASAEQKPHDNQAFTTAVLSQPASSKDHYAQLVQSHTQPAQAHGPGPAAWCKSGMPASPHAVSCAGQPKIAAAGETAIGDRSPVCFSSTEGSAQLHALTGGQSATDVGFLFQPSLAAHSHSSRSAVIDYAPAVPSSAKLPTSAAGGLPTRSHSADQDDTFTGPHQESGPALGIVAVQRPSEIAIQQIGQAVAPSQQSQRLRLHTTAVANPKSHMTSSVTLEESHAPRMPSPVPLPSDSLQPLVAAKPSLEQAEPATLPRDLQGPSCHPLPSELRISDVEQLVPSAPSHAALPGAVHLNARRHPGAEHPHHAPPEPSKSTIGLGMPGCLSRPTCPLFNQPPTELVTESRPMWDANCSLQSVAVPNPPMGYHAAKSAMRVAGADPVPPLDHGDVQNDPACSEASLSDILETIVMAEQQPLTEQEQLSGLVLHEHAECAAMPPAADTSQYETEGVVEQLLISLLQQQPERPQMLDLACGSTDQMSPALPQLKVPHPTLQVGLA